MLQNQGLMISPHSQGPEILFLLQSLCPSLWNVFSSVLTSFCVSSRAYYEQAHSHQTPQDTPLLWPRDIPDLGDLGREGPYLLGHAYDRVVASLLTGLEMPHDDPLEAHLCTVLELHLPFAAVGQSLFLSYPSLFLQEPWYPRNCDNHTLPHTGLSQGPLSHNPCLDVPSPVSPQGNNL